MEYNFRKVCSAYTFVLIFTLNRVLSSWTFSVMGPSITHFAFGISAGRVSFISFLEIVSSPICVCIIILSRSSCRTFPLTIVPLFKSISCVSYGTLISLFISFRISGTDVRISISLICFRRSAISFRNSSIFCSTSKNFLDTLIFFLVLVCEKELLLIIQTERVK